MIATGSASRYRDAASGRCPRIVIAAQTKADQKVRRGDLLFVVEAMKMELRVEAPADGIVRKVLASVGQQVERGQRLAEFEPRR